MDKFEELEKYKSLADKGVISMEEFEEKKKEILTNSDSDSAVISLVNNATDKNDEFRKITSAIIEDSTSMQNNEEESIEHPNSTKADVIKTKKPFYKKPLVWIIAAVLVLFIAIGSGGSDEEISEEKATEQTQTESTQETKATTQKAQMSDDQIVSFLNSSSDWSGEWKAKEDGFYVFYPEGGLADAFNLLIASYTSTGAIPEELQDSYNTMIDGMKGLSSSVDNAAGKPCSLSIVNPSNEENILITFMSGAVLYNAFEE